MKRSEPRRGASGSTGVARDTTPTGFTRATALLSCVLGCVLALATPRSFAAELPEFKLKAAFVFNFVRFTTWPPDRLPDDGSRAGPQWTGILACDAGDRRRPFVPVFDVTHHRPDPLRRPPATGPAS